MVGMHPDAQAHAKFGTLLKFFFPSCSFQQKWLHIELQLKYLYKYGTVCMQLFLIMYVLQHVQFWYIEPAWSISPIQGLKQPINLVTGRGTFETDWEECIQGAFPMCMAITFTTLLSSNIFYLITFWKGTTCGLQPGILFRRTVLNAISSIWNTGFVCRWFFLADNVSDLAGPGVCEEICQPWNRGDLGGNGWHASRRTGSCQVHHFVAMFSFLCRVALFSRNDYTLNYNWHI